MRIEHIVAGVADQLAGRLLRRALLALAIAALAIVSIYFATSAGTLALQARYGAVNAYLIMAAIYAALALAGCLWWAMQGRHAKSGTPAIGQTRELQLVMLVEAAMLGYALARKGERAH
ncbi:MAG: hypothetical protein HY244_17900 [Rhizobiales bacterium]|nr:hypothetical protein [Hyphomicrobiales bacterium]